MIINVRIKNKNKDKRWVNWGWIKDSRKAEAALANSSKMKASYQCIKKEEIIDIWKKTVYRMIRKRDKFLGRPKHIKFKRLVKRCQL